ncbi:phosphopentomutase [Methylovirgula sp. 4M-Z18]|uniref:phosphopentomutase n=1 Tax=Methylovirgula sp. 4M-Z18 TaxID=2293567 RepID=UPI000E2EBFE1|nr:phosphopentomutase [Methylovirgula sp. 4M-Z18]RFB79188.1 phosphopentomutase [Methylovirgula sp. 4M-Z18]
MPRALVLVLDSFGCGAAKDAADYGDVGSDTLGHIAEACALGRGNRAGLRLGPLHLPHLDALGLGLAAEASTGHFPPGFTRGEKAASWGYGVEVSRGKDTPSGHWEIAGTPVPFTWGYFAHTEPAFPADLTAAIIREGHLPGILGDKHASGTGIIEEFGEEHMRTGKPICYTSADSVLQIAAHEESFGLERLYDLCKVVRRLCDPLNIGRVIARPFVGTHRDDFTRTAHRKDFAVPPPAGSMLQRAVEAGRIVVTIGKIGDIFAHQFTGREMKGASNMEHVDQTLAVLQDLPDGGLIFTNLVDFDTDYGHRRDVPGYAACLEQFDARVPELLAALKADDILIVTADHGNDPTYRGSDHTREHVPILAYCRDLPPRPIGRRESFSDIGATVLDWLKLPRGGSGQSWL